MLDLAYFVRKAISKLMGQETRIATLEAEIASLYVQLAEAKAAAAVVIDPAVLQSAQEALALAEARIANLEAEELAEDASEAELVAALSAILPAEPVAETPVEPVAE
jgi:hypothetical protein